MPAPQQSRPRETVYLLLCHDAPGSHLPRELHMRGHLEFIERNIDRIVVGGPALDGESKIDSSVIVLRAASEQEARDFMKGDPYFQNGVWARIDVRRFRAVCGTALGGVTWEPVLGAASA
jgi:hypothetical protein